MRASQQFHFCAGVVQPPGRDECHSDVLPAAVRGADGGDETAPAAGPPRQLGAQCQDRAADELQQAVRLRHRGRHPPRLRDLPGQGSGTAPNGL